VSQHWDECQRHTLFFCLQIGPEREVKMEGNPKIQANYRDNLNSVENLWYLASQEAEQSVYVRLYLKMMEPHLRCLSKAILGGG
jgi:hypothetical protein